MLAIDGNNSSGFLRGKQLQWHTTEHPRQTQKQSRLAGERGGPTTPAVADTTPSRASALLQRMPVRPKEYPHDRGDICTTEGISARLKTRAKRKTCRSRLAGERGGPLTPAVADTMPSRASALLQRMPVRPKEYLHHRRDICTTEGISAPLTTRARRKTCRSRLAGERGGPLTPAVPDTTPSRTSALLQGMPARAKEYLHHRRNICTTEDPRHTQNP